MNDLPLSAVSRVRTSEPSEAERLSGAEITELTGAGSQPKLTISGDHGPEVVDGTCQIWCEVMSVPYDQDTLLRDGVPDTFVGRLQLVGLWLVGLFRPSNRRRSRQERGS